MMTLTQLQCAFALLRFSCSAHTEQTQVGKTLMTQFGRTLGANVNLSTRLCKNCFGYSL